MIPASRRGGLNHVPVANLNTASAPFGMSALGQSGKHPVDQSITGSDTHSARECIIP